MDDVIDLFNSSGFIAFIGIFAAAIAALLRIREHNAAKRFDLVLTKFYETFDQYTLAAAVFKEKTATLSTSWIIEKNADKLDEWITMPFIELERQTMRLSVYFSIEERKVISRGLNVANEFNGSIHGAFGNSKDYFDASQKYDEAKRNFNKQFNPALNELTTLVYKELTNYWRQKK